MKKITSLILILVLTGCFDHHYKVQNIDQYTITERSFTQVYLLFGLISLDGEREICESGESIVSINQHIGFWHIIFTSITGGLVDFSKITYQCGTLKQTETTINA
jgi:hypothetical protein